MIRLFEWHPSRFQAQLLHCSMEDEGLGKMSPGAGCRLSIQAKFQVAVEFGRPVSLRNGRLTPFIQATRKPRVPNSYFP